MTEFPRVGLFLKGYDCAQVDAFFEDARRAYEGGVPPEQFSSEQVRLATFELKNRGYNIDAVDAAMNRLEAAFVKRDRIRSQLRVRQRGTTGSPTVRRPCTRVCSAPAVSASHTRRRDVATPARKLTICWIVSRRTSTRPGS